jgi:hypothetical protein
MKFGRVLLSLCVLGQATACSAAPPEPPAELRSPAVPVAPETEKAPETAARPVSTRGTPHVRPMQPLAAAATDLVAFSTSPFPYDGWIPEQNKPFLDVSSGGRRGHTSPRGGVHWEDETYSDRRVLLHLPKDFDPRRPATIVVFFHGNHATLERDVRDRQRVPDQLDAAGINAALVAPQFAVDAADSSAGRFWEPGVFARFVAEAGARLTAVYGDRRARRLFAAMPVVLVAYSGGYLPAAYSLHVGGAEARLRGVALLDALYGETDKFADWLRRRHHAAFFVSAYSNSSRDENLNLQHFLREHDIEFHNALPTHLHAGTIVFLATGDVVHDDFVTHAWVDDPLTDLFARLHAFRRLNQVHRD